jgi:hypothetical protein
LRAEVTVTVVEVVEVVMVAEATDFPAEVMDSPAEATPE